MRLRSGFTLLELLVVIAIIGLLASIVIMSTQDSRQKASYAQMLEQLHQIELALHLYASDHRNQWGGSWPTTMPPTGGQYQLRHLVNGTTAGATTNFPNFSNYMSSAPLTPIGNDYYAYLNKNRDITTACPGILKVGPDVYEPGISIRIQLAAGAETDALVAYLDEKVDGGDGEDCGRLLYDWANYHNLIYVIANGSSDFPY